MMRRLPFLICLLLCGCSSVATKVPKVTTVLNPTQVNPVAMVQYAAPLVVQQPVATTKTFQWNCDTNTGAIYYTGLERTDSLTNPNWVVVCGFIAQSVNTISITSYTPQAYFRAWTDETNRF